VLQGAHIRSQIYIWPRFALRDRFWILRNFFWIPPNKRIDTQSAKEKGPLWATFNATSIHTRACVLLTSSSPSSKCSCVPVCWRCFALITLTPNTLAILGHFPPVSPGRQLWACSCAPRDGGWNVVRSSVAPSSRILLSKYCTYYEPPNSGPSACVIRMEIRYTRARGHPGCIVF